MLKPTDLNMGFISDSIVDYLYILYNMSNVKVYPYINVNGEAVLLNRRSETSKTLILEFQGKFYLLKEIPWYVNKNQIPEYLELQNYVYMNYKLSPEIIRTKDKELFFVFKEKKYFIQDFVYGENWNKCNIQTYYSAFFLGLYHIESKKCTEKRKKIQRNNILKSTEYMILLLSNFYRNKKELRLNDSKFEINNLLRIARIKSRLLYKSLTTLGYGEYITLNHGDFNPNNLLFDKGNKVKVVFDFDNSGYDDPISDLAEGLVNFSIVEFRKNSSRYSSIKMEPSEELFYAFMNGYFNGNSQKERMLPIISPAIGIVIIRISCLGVLCNCWSIGYAHNIVENIDKITDRVNNLVTNFGDEK